MIEIQNNLQTSKLPSLTGRIKFYDKYGVISDVMENHLSQILYLITAELDGDLDEQRVNVIRSLEPITKDIIKLGQYTGEYKYQTSLVIV